MALDRIKTGILRLQGICREALMIQPDSIKLSSAIARVAGGLLERGGISPMEAEGELKGLLQQSQDLYSIKWLRALIAFKDGDEKAAGFAVEVSKRKNEKSDDIDWVYFSKYLEIHMWRQDITEEFSKRLSKAILMCRRISAPPCRSILIIGNEEGDKNRVTIIIESYVG